MSGKQRNIDGGGWANAGLGLGILWLGCFPGRRQWLFEANSKFATGVVTEVLTMEVQDKASRLGSQTTYYAPVVEFRAESGALVTYHCDTYISPNRYSIGMRLDVRYDPANPARAQLTNPVLVWLWPGVISIIGPVFFVLGAVLCFGGGREGGRV